MHSCYVLTNNRTWYHVRLTTSGHVISPTDLTLHPTHPTLHPTHIMYHHIHNSSMSTNLGLQKVANLLHRIKTR